MTPNQFYDNLLRATAVDPETMDAAREKRDELGKTVVAEVSKRLGTARWVRVGALAQGTQIAPLNDVDGVVEIEVIPLEWEANPRLALETVGSWIEPVIDGTFEISTHAIKIRFPDEDFTADIVIGRKRAKGLLIPPVPRMSRTAGSRPTPSGTRSRCSRGTNSSGPRSSRGRSAFSST